MAGVVAAAPDARVQETQFTLLEGDGNDGEASGSSSAIPRREPKKQKAREYGTVSSGGDSMGSHPRPAEASSTSIPPSDGRSGRVIAPDLLRGLLMVLQSVDHAAVTMMPWKHGIANDSEADGASVDSWNFTTAWIARMLTHLCAPGFMFLLGMGVVYFGRSRKKLGWSTSQMASHFVIRGAVLALVNEVFGLVLGRGRFIIVNIVLLALAVNYVLAGLLWLAFDASERQLSRLVALLPIFRPENEEDGTSQSLLNGTSRKHSSQAAAVSWHLHNLMYFILAALTTWWNIWLSPDGGHCHAHANALSEMPSSSGSSWGPWFDVWFFPIQTRLVISVFPPLAWLSFAILGVLYGRIVLARPWPTSTINLGNMLAGLAFAVLFVATRVFHFGNLSEDCLHMPEHIAHPHRNQYLASFRSFFYIVKYPPSVAFLAFSMSLNFLLLAFFGALPERIAYRIPTLITFGTSALFFYITHLFLYGLLGSLVNGWFGHDLGYTNPMTQKPAVGVGNSPVFWITWLVGLAILYPLCRWFSRFKQAKSPNSIWRFF